MSRFVMTWWLGALACGEPTCPQDAPADETGACIRAAEECPEGYSENKRGDCRWTGDSTAPLTDTAVTTTDTDTTEPSTMDTGVDTGTDTGTTFTGGESWVEWVGLRKFTFLVQPSGAAGGARWEDETLHSPSFAIVFADTEYLDSGFEPDRGFYCEVRLSWTDPVPPTIGGWVSEGGATTGYTLPPSAEVTGDSCAGRIHPFFKDYVERLLATEIGVGLHTLSPAEEVDLYEAVEVWDDVRPFAVGSGWHLGAVDGTSPDVQYSGYGYGIGHEVNEDGSVRLDLVGNPIPMPRDAALPGGPFAATAWFEGEVFVFWPASVLFD